MTWQDAQRRILRKPCRKRSESSRPITADEKEWTCDQAPDDWFGGADQKLCVSQRNPRPGKRAAKRPPPLFGRDGKALPTKHLMTAYLCSTVASSPVQGHGAPDFYLWKATSAGHRRRLGKTCADVGGAFKGPVGAAGAVFGGARPKLYYCANVTRPCFDRAAGGSAATLVNRTPRPRLGRGLLSTFRRPLRPSAWR